VGAIVSVGHHIGQTEFAVMNRYAHKISSNKDAFYCLLLQPVEPVLVHFYFFPLHQIVCQAVSGGEIGPFFPIVASYLPSSRWSDRPQKQRCGRPKSPHPDQVGIGPKGVPPAREEQPGRQDKFAVMNCCVHKISARKKVLLLHSGFPVQ
jgi:hypothetical protein